MKRGKATGLALAGAVVLLGVGVGVTLQQVADLPTWACEGIALLVVAPLIDRATRLLVG